MSGAQPGNRRAGPLADWVHAITEVPAHGLDVERQADTSERIALAAALDIVALELLTVTYRIKPFGTGRYRLTGSLQADVTQACIVTLAPVAARIREEIAEEFWPAAELGEVTAGEAAEHEALAAPVHEPIEDGAIAVGRIVYEQLATAIDPYPRAPGATFAWSDAPDKGAEPPSAPADHPFAALKRLKET